MFESNETVNAILRKAGSVDINVSNASMAELATAVTMPLRQGVLDGAITDVFEPLMFEPGVHVEMPLDLLAPGTEGEWVAFTMPGCGYIPQMQVEGDRLTIPTFYVGASIDTCLQYIRDARWDVVRRMLEVLRASHTKKMNNDGWHTILAAGYDRNIIAYDTAATDGQFSKRLVSLMKLGMRRNGGGNSTSVNRGRLTDLYISPEAMEDVRDWNVDDVDEVTRREIFVADGDEAISRIFGVNLHVLDELGVSQEYELYYEVQLNGSLGAGLPGSKEEIVVGLDLSKNDSFVMPIREQLQVFNDPVLHRQMRAGFYSWQELGFAVLDGRRVLLGAL